MRRTKPLQLPSPWLELALAYGGRKNLASVIGVSETTIYRWAMGKSKPSKFAVIEIKRIAESKGLVFSLKGNVKGEDHG